MRRRTLLILAQLLSGMVIAAFVALVYTGFEFPQAQSQAKAVDPISRFKESTIPTNPIPSPSGGYAYSHVLKEYIPRMVGGSSSQCDFAFGWDLVKTWRKSGKAYCTKAMDVPGSGFWADPSELVCARIQQWKHSGSDAFCTGTNIMIDYGMMTNMTIGKWDAVNGENRYYEPLQGAVVGKCDVDPKEFVIEPPWPTGRFQQLYKPFFAGFEGRIDALPDCDEVVEHPVLLVMRDGYWNTYHSMADLVNAHLGLEILGLGIDDLQCVILDQEIAGAYFPLWKNAFSPNHPLIHAPDLVHAKKKVCYKNLIVNIPGVSSYMCKDISTRSECWHSDLLKAYALHAVRAMGIEDVTLPAPFTMTIIVRKKHPEKKKMDRVISNLDNLTEIVRDIIPKGQLWINVVDLAELSMADQMAMIRGTNVLAGAHGAGLTQMMFMRPGGFVLEMQPTNGNFHFINMASWCGHHHKLIQEEIFGKPQGFVKLSAWRNAVVGVYEQMTNTTLVV